ncbi:hypothetical protein SAMN05192568_10984 [Methylobacterium pseudosasicola]|uniref:Uncharacterized protein n=1 Tax=Methylobacterium pseudosasicola TaxID=582667 RepID=A0A1I4VFL7_9HYPH|nr:hypothetical protein [Methylobacterium pseudosasicola]SFM99920.1 hypothetical protein SAMN05192568_10984 [Methylobacterium pseudosasicola]
MLDRPIIGLAVWLSKPTGFLATCFTVAAGLGSGALLSFNDHWALVFNLFLSIAAMLLAGVILVAGAEIPLPSKSSSMNSSALSRTRMICWSGLRNAAPRSLS